MTTIRVNRVKKNRVKLSLVVVYINNHPDSNRVLKIYGGLRLYFQLPQGRWTCPYCTKRTSLASAFTVKDPLSASSTIAPEALKTVQNSP